MDVSAQFTDSLFANLDYWHQRLTSVNERQFTSLVEDWPNIIRAVQYGSGVSSAQMRTVQLALSAFDFVERRGYWHEWLPWLSELARHADLQPAQQRAALLEQLGHCHRLSWQLPKAIQLHLEAKAIMQAANDTYEVTRIQHALSEDYRLNRQYDEAEACGLAALEGFQQLGLAETARKGGVVLNTLGLIAQARGDLSKGEEYLRKAVRVMRSEDSPTELGRTLKNLANVLEAQGQRETALTYLTEAEQILSQTASDLEKFTTTLSLSNLYFNAGQLQEAERVLYDADVKFLRRAGHIYYEAAWNNNLGHILVDQGRLNAASQYLENSVNLWRRTTDIVMLANTLGTLAAVLAKMGKRTEALPCYDEALTLLAPFPEDAWATRLHQRFTQERSQLLIELGVSSGTW